MEEYRNKVVNYQPINPRISVNLPVKLARNPHRGGAWGASPLYEPSRECISPPDRGGCHGASGPDPQGGLLVCLTPWEWRDYVAPGARPGMDPPPGWPPLYLGSIGRSFVYRFLPIFLDFLGRLSRYSSHT